MNAFSATSTTLPSAVGTRQMDVQFSGESRALC